jgi:hypothetical protein
MGPVIMLIFFGLGSAYASSANISHSYHSDQNIPNGSLVSIDPNKSDYVELSNTSNDAQLLGVTLASKDSLLAFDPSNTTIQVATSGIVYVRVSTVNGDIKIGDQVTASPFSGLGMEAGQNRHEIGIAQTPFSYSSSQATVENVTDKNGKSHTIKVGYIRISIALGTYSTSGNGSQANFMQLLIKSWTGHTIPTSRILLSILVGFITILLAGTIVYASIYGSIVSVGRNPLAQHAIYKSVASVMVLALFTFTIASVTIYYLLH